MLVLCAMLGIAFAVLAGIAWRHPLLVRLGLRNLARRRAQTLLIVFGLMLSTLIISAAFATGDTVSYSITNTVYRSLRGADLLIAFDPNRAAPDTAPTLTTRDYDRLRAALQGDPNIDGLTPLVALPVPIVNRAARLSEPRARLVGVDPATVDVFDGLRKPNDTTLSAAALGEHRAFITQNLAREINAKAGDRVTAYYDNKPYEFEVLDVVQDTAVAMSSANIGLATGGMVIDLATLRTLTGKPDAIDSIALSMRGGTRDTAPLNDAVKAQVERVIQEQQLPAMIQIGKQQLVGFAEIAGSLFVTFFLVFGLFSIAAGLLLIFLIFIMLAAERRAEMGISRAIGMQRRHLMESFLAEGMAYNVGSALVGALLGLGVSALLILIMRAIFNRGTNVQIAFHFNWQGFVVSYAAGVVLTFLTVAFSAQRAAHLNIVAAIRDLPDAPRLRARDRSARALGRAVLGAGLLLLSIAAATLGTVASLGALARGLATHQPVIALGALLIGSATLAATWLLRRALRRTSMHRNAGGWAIWMLIAGAALLWLGGWQLGQAFPYTGGFTLGALGIAMLAVYFGGSARLWFTIAGIGLLWYWLLPLPFSIVLQRDSYAAFEPVRALATLLHLPPQRALHANVEMFFLSGIAMTSAAILVVIFNAQMLLNTGSRAMRLFGSLAPAMRTAIAYPLAARFRTAMTLAMFTLVIFSLVVMATLNSNFSQLFLGDEATAGFDIVATGSANNRVSDLREALNATNPNAAREIADVGTLSGASVDVRQPGARQSDFRRYLLQGADDAFLRLARLPLAHRANGYATDEAVMTALRTDPNVAIADDAMLAASGPFGRAGSQQRFSIENSASIHNNEAFDPVQIEVRDRQTGTLRRFTIIGFLQPQVTGAIEPLAALYTTRAVVAESFHGGDTDAFLVTVTGSHSRSHTVAVARDVESALFERGLQADSIHEIIARATAQSTGFQILFEAFMGLGLIVGIAALGVIGFRTVVERRQQIGMLRAIGYTQRLVALSFFFESSFIALTGIGLGLILGEAISYNLLTSPDFTQGVAITFHVPWLRILLIVAIAYGASALMTVLPARAASRVAVAEALRYE